MLYLCLTHHDIKAFGYLCRWCWMCWSLLRCLCWVCNIQLWYWCWMYWSCLCWCWMPWSYLWANAGCFGCYGEVVARCLKLLPDCLHSDDVNAECTERSGSMVEYNAVNSTFLAQSRDDPQLYSKSYWTTPSYANDKPFTNFILSGSDKQSQPLKLVSENVTAPTWKISKSSGKLLKVK